MEDCLIVKVLKEGDLLDSSNWRGLTPLSLTSKKFSKVKLELFSATLDKDIREEKAGFRKKKSCSDHIFTLKQIMERAWKSTVYANYIAVFIEKRYGAYCDTMKYHRR